MFYLNASATFSPKISFELILNLYVVTSSIGICNDFSQNVKPHFGPIVGPSWPKNFGTKFFPNFHVVQL